MVSFWQLLNGLRFPIGTVVKPRFRISWARYAWRMRDVSESTFIVAESPSSPGGVDRWTWQSIKPGSTYRPSRLMMVVASLLVQVIASSFGAALVESLVIPSRRRAESQWCVGRWTCIAAHAGIMPFGACKNLNVDGNDCEGARNLRCTWPFASSIVTCL